MQFIKTWFNILLHSIHFLKFFSQPQSNFRLYSNFNVDSNSDCVLVATWSVVCDPHKLLSPLGRAVLCVCSAQRLVDMHGMGSIPWAELGHQRPFSRLALQSQPYRACLPVYVVLLLFFCFSFDLYITKRQRAFEHLKIVLQLEPKRTALHCRNSEGRCLSWRPGDLEEAWDDIRNFEHSYWDLYRMSMFQILKHCD